MLNALIVSSFGQKRQLNKYNAMTFLSITNDTNKLLSHLLPIQLLTVMLFIWKWTIRLWVYKKGATYCRKQPNLIIICLNKTARWLKRNSHRENINRGSDVSHAHFSDEIQKASVKSHRKNEHCILRNVRAHHTPLNDALLRTRLLRGLELYSIKHGRTQQSSVTTLTTRPFVVLFVLVGTRVSARRKSCVDTNKVVALFPETSPGSPRSSSIHFSPSFF